MLRSKRKPNLLRAETADLLAELQRRGFEAAEGERVGIDAGPVIEELRHLAAVILPDAVAELRAVRAANADLADRADRAEFEASFLAGVIELRDDIRTFEQTTESETPDE